MELIFPYKKKKKEFQGHLAPPSLGLPFVVTRHPCLFPEVPRRTHRHLNQHEAEQHTTSYVMLPSNSKHNSICNLYEVDQLTKYHHLDRNK